MYFIPMLLYSVTWICVAAMIAQSPTRDEKRAAKVRTEYVKATMEINVPTIRADSLKAHINDTDLVLVDVRLPGEQKVSMLPNAVTTKAFAEKFRTGFPTHKRIVVYDVLGYRSGKYAEQLIEKKLDVRNLEGGILAWTHAGGELIRYDSAGTAIPTRQVHTYEKDMRSWASMEYDAVW